MTARTAVLSAGQLALLAEHGEERRAEVGDVLFRIGDQRYPMVVRFVHERLSTDVIGAPESPSTPPRRVHEPA